MTRARSYRAASLGLAAALMGLGACTSPPEREPDVWPTNSSKTPGAAKTPATKANPPAPGAAKDEKAAAKPKPAPAEPAAAAAAAPTAPKAGAEGYASPDLLKIPRGERDLVLASVAGEEVRASDLYPYLFVSFNPQTMRAIQTCVISVLVAKEAARIGIRVPESEIQSAQESAIAEQKQQIQQASKGSVTFEDWLRDNLYMTLDQ